MKKVNINIYSVEQAAKLFDVNEDTMRRWARKKIIPSKKIGKLWFFEEKIILDFFNTFKDAKNNN